MPTDDITLISQTRSTDEGTATVLETVLPPGVESRNYNLIVTCDICTEHDICVHKETEVKVTPRNVNEEELRAAVKEIDALYAEKNCLEAISVSRMLLATLKDSPDGSNWNKLRNGGCGAFFRATKACMNDLQTRLLSG